MCFGHGRRRQPETNPLKLDSRDYALYREVLDEHASGEADSRQVEICRGRSRSCCDGIVFKSTETGAAVSGLVWVEVSSAVGIQSPPDIILLRVIAEWRV